MVHHGECEETEGSPLCRGLGKTKNTDWGSVNWMGADKKRNGTRDLDAGL